MTKYIQRPVRGREKQQRAIWPWKCKDALFQYNEAYHTCDNQDGQAWDADAGDVHCLSVQLQLWQ